MNAVCAFCRSSRPADGAALGCGQCKRLLAAPALITIPPEQPRVFRVERIAIPTAVAERFELVPPGELVTDVHRCAWCREPLDNPRLTYCNKTHRQAAYRARHNTKLNLEQHVRRVVRAFALEGAGRRGLRLAYADPPYPGKAYVYRNEPSYGGEVDHAELVARLQTFDGWALSTSAEALRSVLPLCPPEAFVAAWGKSKRISGNTRGKHNNWEPLIVKPARRFKPGVSDFLGTSVARGGGTLMGRKPVLFCLWVFKLLGALPGDELADLYPGTGVVTSAFDAYCASLAAAERDASLEASGRDASPGDGERDVRRLG